MNALVNNVKEKIAALERELIEIKRDFANFKNEVKAIFKEEKRVAIRFFEDVKDDFAKGKKKFTRFFEDGVNEARKLFKP